MSEVDRIRWSLSKNLRIGGGWEAVYTSGCGQYEIQEERADSWRFSPSRWRLLVRNDREASGRTYDGLTRAKEVANIHRNRSNQ